MGKKFICTYFDINYLPRGLALFNSIKKYHDDFKLFILTFDDSTFNYLNSLNDDKIELISHQEYNSYFNTSIERFDDKKQYFFSSTPNLCLYVLRNNPEIDILLYLDADVYLFSSIEPLYEEFGNYSIGLTPHNIHPFLKYFVKHYGTFNVGVNLFRNDSIGIKCLEDWKSNCDNWYQGKPGYPLKFFSDQIFLDSWINEYDKIKVIENPGINLVYWNVVNYKLSREENYFMVNDQKLIIFHFSSLNKISSNKWKTNSKYGLVSVKNVLKEIYLEYINNIESYGLPNDIRVKLNHKDNLKKRIFNFIISPFFNELVTIK
jgi:hypothetical protein